MPYDIFISYSRANSTSLAHYLYEALTHQGWSVFMDVRKQDGGGTFPERLRLAIEESRVVVCLLGETSLQSTWVNREIEIAHQNNKVMIPVFQEKYTAPAGTPSPSVQHLHNSQGVHFLDVRSLFFEQATADLISIIQDTLGNHAHRSQRPIRRLLRWIEAHPALMGLVGVGITALVTLAVMLYPQWVNPATPSATPLPSYGNEATATVAWVLGQGLDGAGYAQLGNRLVWEEQAYASAAVALQQALQLGEISDQVYTDLAEVYYQQGQYEQATEQYQLAITLNPNNPLPYYNRANLYSALSLYEQALADYQTVLSLDPTFANAYYNRGNLYRQLDELAAAIRDYTEAIQLASDYTLAYYNRAVSYNDLEKFELALADFEEVLRLEPNYTLAYAGQGFALLNLGRLSEALLNFEQAIILDPTYALAYNNRGIIHEELGNFPQAQADYCRALVLAPQLELARANLQRNGWTCLN